MADRQPDDDPLTFYARLEPFDDFAHVTDRRWYTAAPADWIIVLADIEGSTEAARAGRYKDVNLIGAACITAPLNVTRGLDLPYVFGGDGATLLIPPQVQEPVARALAQTRRLAAAEFDLRLRVGMMPISEVVRAGREVLVAKFALSPGNCLAMFAGGGLELADRLIKAGPAFRLADPVDPGPPDLEGLSCRWEPCRSEHGQMVSLMVRSLEPDSLALQQDVMSALNWIMGGAAAAAQPVRLSNLRFAWPPAGLRAEIRLGRGRPQVRRRAAWLYLESFLQALAERFRLRIGPYDGRSYRSELQRNSDHRKIADVLQIILDCTTAQADAIQQDLDRLHRQGRIVYGLHRADRAMMTCLVFSLEQHRHVHFVDGADGGYALAASQLKEQLARRA